MHDPGSGDPTVTGRLLCRHCNGDGRQPLCVPICTRVCRHCDGTGACEESMQLAERSSAAPFDATGWTRGKLLGSGTFGDVYLATNERTKDTCAVKIVQVRPDTDVAAIATEVDTMARLSHPNIVEYRGHRIGAQFLCIFLEFLPGGSLKGCMKSTGALSEATAVQVLNQVLCGLDYLHRERLVHRDIKSGNVLVTAPLDQDGVAKLADFGTAKRLEKVELTTRETTVMAKTMTGSVPWMAPEVVQGTGHSFSADIWACGCLLIEMVTGQNPWGEAAHNQFALLFKIGKGEVPKIPTLLSATWQFQVTLMLQRSPRERPTASQILEGRFDQGGVARVAALHRPSLFGSASGSEDSRQRKREDLLGAEQERLRQEHEQKATKGVTARWRQEQERELLRSKQLEDKAMAEATIRSHEWKRKQSLVESASKLEEKTQRAREQREKQERERKQKILLQHQRDESAAQRKADRLGAEKARLRQANEEKIRRGLQPRGQLASGDVSPMRS